MGAVSLERIVEQNVSLLCIVLEVVDVSQKKNFAVRRDVGEDNLQISHHIASEIGIVLKYGDEGKITVFCHLYQSPMRHIAVGCAIEPLVLYSLKLLWQRRQTIMLEQLVEYAMLPIVYGYDIGVLQHLLHSEFLDVLLLHNAMSQYNYTKKWTRFP